MTKRLIPFLAFVVTLSVPAVGQVLNGGFESWTAGTPDNWFTNSAAGLYTTISQTTDSHSGSYAAKGSVATFNSTPIPPLLFAGTAEQGFSVSARNSSVTGYYKFTPSGGDSLYVVVLMSKAGSTIGDGLLSTGATVSSYTAFTVPISYVTNDVPDKVTIEFEIAPANGSTVHSGSVFEVDDVALGAATSVGEGPSQTPATYSLAQNYPNPFNPSTTISFSVPKASFVTLKIYDILGNEVSTLVNREMGPGSYTETWNAQSFPSGIYFYRLFAGPFSDTKRLVLMK